MLILITSNGDNLESTVSPRFGRSPWFIEFDTVNETWQAHENQAVSQRGGAGVAASQFVIDQGVQAVISGNFGPNAQQALGAGGVEMHTFDSDRNSVKEVIHAFQVGKLNQIQ